MKDYSDETFRLLHAENLIVMFLEFIDNECPAIGRRDKKPNDEEICGLICYASRTEMFISALNAAHDIISQVRKSIEFEMDKESVKSKESLSFEECEALAAKAMTLKGDNLEQALRFILEHQKQEVKQHERITDFQLQQSVSQNS